MVMGLAAVEVLRRQMRERFPRAHGFGGGVGGGNEGEERDVLNVGGVLDVGMFAVGGISEVVAVGRCSGISLLVAGLLEGEGLEEVGGVRMVLVDGADGFDPGSFSSEVCGRVLWVRCRGALEMVRAADVLVHDGNMRFVVLDAMGLEGRDLGGVPAAAWWRLRQVVGRTGCRLVVLVGRSVVPCASVRLGVGGGGGLGLEDFDGERGELLGRLEVSRLRDVRGRRLG